MRAWNEYATTDRPAMLKGALIFSAGACTLGSIVVGMVFALVLSGSFATPLALAATLYLLTFTLSQTSSHLVRTAVGVTAGDGTGILLVMAPAIIYLALCLTGHQAADLGTVLLWFSAGGTAVLGIHAMMIWRRIQVLFPEFSRVTPAYDIKSWGARSLKLWISTGLEASNQFIDVLLIGYLMSPTVAGAYFVTTRLANVFATATDAIHMFSTRHIPDLYFARISRASTSFSIPVCAQWRCSWWAAELSPFWAAAIGCLRYSIQPIRPTIRHSLFFASARRPLPLSAPAHRF